MGCMRFSVDSSGDFFSLDYDFVEIFEKGINVTVTNSLITKRTHHLHQFLHEFHLSSLRFLLL